MALSSDAQTTLEAIRRIVGRSGDPSVEIHRDQVNDELRVPHGDKHIQNALAELAEARRINVETEVDQIPGPISFRMVP